MTCGIYQIRNLVNGKIYVGSSKEINKRWTKHRIDLRKNCHHSILLQRAWNKYGKENFVFEIMEETDKKSLIIREQYYLDLLKSYDRKIGYNINTQSDLSQAVKERWDNKQYRKSQLKMMNGLWNKQRKKLHHEQMKHRWSNQTYRTEFAKQRVGTGNPFYGKSHSKKIKKQISGTVCGQWKEKTKEWILKNRIIKIIKVKNALYLGGQLASEQLGITVSCLFWRCKNKNKKWQDYSIVDKNNLTQKQIKNMLWRQ